jgi:hypothetical protein
MDEYGSPITPIRPFIVVKGSGNLQQIGRGL